MDSHRTVTIGILLLLGTTAGVRAAQPLAFSRIDAPSSPGARGIATGDFDRNGWTDVAHANFGRNTVSVLLNQGGTPPAFLLAHDIAVGAGPFDLTTADFNRDGILDLAVTNNHHPDTRRRCLDRSDRAVVGEVPHVAAWGCEERQRHPAVHVLAGRGVTASKANRHLALV